jgi:hypothetical protein
MSSLLKQYGGDWSKALIAYNGGGGAVAAWDSGQPYQESQTYVARILGGSRPNQSQAGGVAQPASTTTVAPRSTAMDQSQFGDPQLTSDEAYAACGPAAAVRFAQAYGRNPTLREATDLASQVGWTPGSGMAGIGSEQKLLDKMGIPTKLVGADAAAIAKEAQTGNPVTISTPGHYFYADGYNAQTGQFHVGRSGLDLKSGAEWMTLQQMQSLMGPVQGALFANSPTTTNPSTSQDPLAQLDAQRQAAPSVFSGFRTPTIAPARPQSNDPQVQQLDRAVEIAHMPTQRPTFSELADTTSAAQPQQPGEVARSGGIGDLGNIIGNAITSALSAAGLGGTPPGGGSPRRSVPDQNQDQFNPDTSNLADFQPRPDVGTRARQMIEQLQTLPGGHSLASIIGAPDLLPPDMKDMPIAEAIREAIDKGGQNAMNLQRPTPGPGGLGIFDPRLGNDPRMDIPDAIEPIGQLLERIGGATGLSRLFERVGAEHTVSALDQAFEREAGGAGRALTGGVSQDVLDALRPSTGDVLPSNIGTAIQDIARNGQDSLASSLSRTRGQQAWDAVVRNLTDSGTDLNNIEKEMALRKGSPLTDSERVGLLARVDPTRRLAEANAELDRAASAHAQALADQRAVDVGVHRTRESVSLNAAGERVRGAQSDLTDALDNARDAAAAHAHEATLRSSAGELVRRPEQRDLTIAQSDAQRANARFERIAARDQSVPIAPTGTSNAVRQAYEQKVASLARQAGYAEDRLSQLRQAMGETTATREAAVGERAASAAQAARERGYVPPTPELAAARVKLRYEQQNLDRLQTAKARGQQGLVDDLARAYQRVNVAQRDVDVATRDLPEAARAQGWAQLTGREFAGPNGETIHYDDVMQQLADLKAKYADRPEVWNRMQDGLRALSDMRTQMLQEKVDHGMIDQQTMDDLLKAYDFWTPTRMTDYMTDQRPGMGLQRGGRFNVGSPGFRSYTPEGSSLEHENHVAALIREMYSHKSGVARNDVNSALINGLGSDSNVMKKIADSVEEYNAAGGKAGPLLQPDYTPKANEMKITGMLDGKRQDYVTDNTLLKTALQQTGGGDTGVLQKLLQAPAQLVRETAVQRNPGFLPVNLARDSIAYAIRNTAEGGLGRNLASTAINLGPAALTAATTSRDDPNRGQKIAAAAAAGIGTRVALGKNLGLGPSAAREFLAAFGDAMEGIGTGRMTGQGTRDLALSGAGIRGGGFFSGEGGAGPRAAEEELRRLTRQNVLTVRNGGDLKQLLSDAAGFGWVKALGNRMEQVPRVATYRMALERGATPLEAMIKARDVTTDFNRGGRLTRELNRYVPFFNVGVQAPAQLGRLIKDHPVGALYSGLTLLGAPAAATEAWNYSDPQRARDYNDVPQYLKNMGVVIMLPGEAPRDAQGNRVPQKIFLPIPNEFMPFVTAGREGYKHISGQGTPQSAGSLAGSLAQELSPLGASSPEGAIYGQIPPPLGTIAALQTNRDPFRGSTIANQYSDENASNLGKLLAPLLTDAVTQLPGHQLDQVHPSHVDYAIRDTFSGLGQQGLNAVDALSRRPARVPGTVAETPLVGGLASRFVRGTGGQELQNARQELLSPSAARTLRDAGIEWTPSAVQPKIGTTPLLNEEQARLQSLTNRYIDDAVQRSVRTSMWQNGTNTTKQRLITYTTGIARQRAQQEVLRTIPASERLARVQAARAKATA